MNEMSDSEPLPYYKSHPMPVTSFVGMKTPAENSELVLPIQWGGYYYLNRPDYNGYEIVRLLDWRADSCHFQALGTVQVVPSIVEVDRLRPVAWHLPLPLEYFFNTELTYLGARPLALEDLYGYQIYLQQLEWSADRIESVLDGLIHYSKMKPLIIRMTYQAGEVKDDIVQEEATDDLG